MTTGQRQQVFFWLGALALILFGVYLLSGILLPFVAGLAIAYFLDPAVDRLEAWRLPRGMATLVVLMLFMLSLVLVALLLLPLLQLQAAELARRLPVLLEAARREIEYLMQLAEDRLAPEDFAKLRGMAGDWAGSAARWLVGFFEGVLTKGIALANLLSLVFITPVVSFFLLRDWDRLVARIDGWIPRHHLETVREQSRLVHATLAGFIHGQLLVSLTLALYYAVTLTFVGLGFGVIVGLLIGILSFVPFVGVAVGFTLAMGLAFMQFSQWTGIAIVAGIFAVGQMLESNILSPKLVGDRVNLHPVWVIFALLAFGTLFGFAGVLLALPAAAVIGVLVRFALSSYLASPLFDPANRRGDADGRE